MIQHVMHYVGKRTTGRHHQVIADTIYPLGEQLCSWPEVTVAPCSVCGRTVVRGMGRWWEDWVPTPAGIRAEPGA